MAYVKSSCILTCFVAWHYVRFIMRRGSILSASFMNKLCFPTDHSRIRIITQLRLPLTLIPSNIRQFNV